MLFQKSGEAQSKTAAHCLLYVFRGIITVLRIFFVLKISGSEVTYQDMLCGFLFLLKKFPPAEFSAVRSDRHIFSAKQSFFYDDGIDEHAQVRFFQCGACFPD